MAKRKRKSATDEMIELFNSQCVQTEEFGAVVVCPICLRLFDRSDIEPRRGGAPLSIEHAPQTSHSRLDGVERCLTCRSCNNNCGFEARHGNRQVLRATETFVLPKPPTLRTAQQRASGLWTQRIHQPHVHVRTKKGVVISQTMPRGIHRPHRDEFLIELKNAYLIAFARLGYSYILDPALEVVRSAIRNETALTCCARTDLSNTPITHGELAVVEIGGERGIVVAIEASHPTRSGFDHIVYLPRPGSSTRFYESLEAKTHLSGRTSQMVITDGVYGFPTERQLLRHWDDRTCDEDHPVTSAKTGVFEFECDEHGRERGLVVQRPVGASLFDSAS